MTAEYLYKKLRDDAGHSGGRGKKEEGGENSAV